MKKKFSAIILASCIFTSQASTGFIDWAKENPTEVVLVSVVGCIGTIILCNILKSSKKHRNCKGSCCSRKK